MGHSQYISQSQNGVLWQYHNNPTQQSLRKVRWNGELGHYIAVGEQGAIAISHDGAHWKAYEIKEKPNLNHILWCVKKKHYVLIGEKGYIALSQDGIRWKKQSCPISGHLFDIATSAPWDEKLLYVVISREDHILESEDGITWTVAVKPQQFLPKEARSIVYNHRYGLNMDGTGLAYYKFFTVMGNNRTTPGYLYRWYRYYNTNQQANPKLPPAYTFAWTYNQIYIESPNATNLFSGVSEFHWFEEIKLYVGVAEIPWVFYNDGIKDLTHIHYRTEIKSPEIKYAFKSGFCSITIGNIPEYKSDEKTVYLDLAKYR